MAQLTLVSRLGTPLTGCWPQTIRPCLPSLTPRSKGW